MENALIDFDGTLLFVSHDRYFVNRVAAKVMRLRMEQLFILEMRLLSWAKAGTKDEPY
ncbi:MAG: hypothetical protein ACLTE3_03285 [Streptococcus salivarius]